MYNVDKLERQWIGYRRKKMILPAVAVVFVIAAVSVALYMGTVKKVSDQNEAKIAMEEKHTTLSDNTQETPGKTLGKLDILATGVPSLSTTKKRERPRAGQIIFQDTNEGTHTQIKKKKNLLIQVTERGGKDIAVDIENRFEFAQDKSDSLFLAKYYYDKMEYTKAAKWALETNKLDNVIEESWLIFAKSLAKQGKRIESLKVLRAFLEQGKSVKARALMDKIRRGKSF